MMIIHYVFEIANNLFQCYNDRRKEVMREHYLQGTV